MEPREGESTSQRANAASQLLPPSTRTSAIYGSRSRCRWLILLVSLVGLALLQQFRILMNVVVRSEPTSSLEGDTSLMMGRAATASVAESTMTRGPLNPKSRMNSVVVPNATRTETATKSTINNLQLRPLTGHRYEVPHQLSNQSSSLLIYSDHNKDCVCDLVSVDCLHMLKCHGPLYTEYTVSSRQDSAQLGRSIRQVMRETAIFPRKRSQYYDSSTLGWAPVGKTLQYTAIATYKRWVQSNRLPLAMHPAEHSSFCNYTWYPECVNLNIHGKACFFRNVNETEELDGDESDGDPISPTRNAASSMETLSRIKEDLERFRQQASSSTKSSLPPLSYLLSFAHIVRLRFELRSFLHRIYRQRVVRITHVNSTKSSRSLRISLHLRRADACHHAQEGYEQKGSPLDSPAQTTNQRKCYATLVYLDQLRRMQAILGDETVLDVYLSTDHAGSVMEEIRTDHADLYTSMNWYYLNYADSDTFNYQGVIEIDTTSDKQAILGESAVEDLFHVSHGQVFIGHLGSRFGKISWLLMTARYNRFVPFFTPDGHSFCCEIDEACGEAKPYVTDMENCMTFSHELAYDIPMNGPPEGYWQVGSRKRKAFAAKQEKIKHSY